MTGGVSARDLKASMRVYFVTVDDHTNRCEFTILKSLIDPRYGHC